MTRTNTKNRARHFARLRLLTLSALAAVTFAGCQVTKPLKGGNALTTRNGAGEFIQTLAQGQNAATPSRQDQHFVRVRTYTLPQASRIEEAHLQKAPSGVTLTNLQTTILSAPAPIIEREETHATTELGAAQKDTAREFGAKLSSLKPITWIGVAMFIFGLASLTWPPLCALIGSVTTSIAILLGGILLITLPTLLVGNELLILGGVAVTVGSWFLAHRHGQLRGVLETHQALTNRNLRPPKSFRAQNTPNRPGANSRRART